MVPMLTVDDFSTFFQEVHGCAPFPWQKRLLEQVAANGQWPQVLDLPTGSGKTAAIDIAVFHLALEAGRSAERRAPVRIAFVVDRRLVVDDAFERARKIEWAIAEAKGEISKRVAERLRLLSGDDAPLIARRLRGGIPREDDWARTPSQPTVLCSTVDQVGSRILFRGYGVSDSMKPVHAGLFGADCLILLDEAHLAEPFRQTMEWIGIYGGASWREAAAAAPWGSALLTATPGEMRPDTFSLGDDDRSNLVLKPRLEAEKPAFLVGPAKSKKSAEPNGDADQADHERDARDDTGRRASAIVQEVRKALQHFKKTENGAAQPVIGVVVNRVGRARAVFQLLRHGLALPGENDADKQDIILMIGPARPVDRDDLVERLRPIRTRVWAAGEDRALDKPLVLVATQCIEAGVDIDLDALITEAAPLDSLQQRFGRLNRAGRRIRPYAAIVAEQLDISARSNDAVYGKAIKPAWEYLCERAKDSAGSAVDFGIRALQLRVGTGTSDKNSLPVDALTEKRDAPVLLPAHLDLLSQTAPIPAADPDVSLYLHGPERQPDSITVIWRADIEEGQGRDLMIRLLTLVPPRSGEAIDLPVWIVRRWLEGGSKSAADVADIPARGTGDDEGRGGKKVFRWKGDDERSQWVRASEIRPGDTIVVPADYGGVDEYGWNPERGQSAVDVAFEAAEPFAQRKFVVRVAPGLLDADQSDALARKLATMRTEGGEGVRQAILDSDLDIPDTIKPALRRLGDAKGRAPRVIADFDCYGENERGEPRGVILSAPFGIKVQEGQKGSERGGDGGTNFTEDNSVGLFIGIPLSLDRHSRDVEAKAEEFAKRAGLPAERVADIRLAGLWHDLGKKDSRFQAWLHFSDPLGFDDEDDKNILAKSGQVLPPLAREKSGLPDHWRHEARSVLLASMEPDLIRAFDPDLVLWLVGSHHGNGRPLFPHEDAEEKAPAVGPQSLAFDWKGTDWPSLFSVLRARYGVWELARMEAIIRLADHRASEMAAKEMCE